MKYFNLFLSFITFQLIFCSCQKEISTDDALHSARLSTERLAAVNSILQFPGKGRQMAITFSFDSGSKAYIGLGMVNHNYDTTFTDLWEFDARTAAWTRKADFPGSQRICPTSFTLGQKGYVVGGAHDNAEVWEYDPATDQWTRKHDFPVSDFYWAASFTINGKAYVGTGLRKEKPVKDFWAYDPITDTWTQKADYGGKAVDAAVGFSLAGKGYFAGGSNFSALSSDVWQYDPVTDIWTQKRDFPYAGYTTVVFALQGKAYVGGMGFGTKLWAYDTTNTWSVAIDSIGRHGVGARAFTIGNKAYIGLGTTAYGYYPKDIWQYEIQ